MSHLEQSDADLDHSNTARPLHESETESRVGEHTGTFEAIQRHIMADPSLAKTWFEKACTLFGLRRYREAYDACSRALCCRPAPPHSMRDHLRLLKRTCRLLLRLAYSDDQTRTRPTARLQRDWYRSRLQELLDSGSLAALPTESELQLTGGVCNLTDCALISRPAGNDGSDWEDVYDTRAGGERNIPASVLRGFPLDQATGGYLYLKEKICSLGCNCYDEGKGPCQVCLGHPECLCDPGVEGICPDCSIKGLPRPTHCFPRWAPVPARPVEAPGGPFLDVQVATGLVPAATHKLLQEKLDELAVQRHDSPAPMYHNIIDPNVGAVDGLWVPTEFEATEVSDLEVVLETACERATGGYSLPPGFARRVCEMSKGTRVWANAKLNSIIPDLDPSAHSELYVAVEQVFETALPLLACLRRPCLLLPGPLQAVVKAQRIVLREDELYEGVWHEDGLREHVVAVVLYYYRVSSSLSGGAMEFISKQRTMMWTGDNNGDYEMSSDGARKLLAELPRCIAPIEEGTMLVFGNYAAIHRVLPIIANGGPGSRDFLALFVIDQKAPLPLPSELGPRSARVQARGSLLREQLQTRGLFTIDSSDVYSTGNGSLADVAWLAAGENGHQPEEEWMSEYDFWQEAYATISQLNMVPPVVGRGSSYLAELEGPHVAHNPESSWVQHVIGDPVELVVFVNPSEMEYRVDPPEEGIREVRVFTDLAAWAGNGYWTKNNELRARVESAVRQVE